MKENLEITHFTDYRSFLLAHVQDIKKSNSRWTYGVWANQMKLKSTSSITKIIQGQREPGPQITEKLLKYFKFDKSNQEYFKDLIRLHKVKKDPRLAALIMERMGKNHPDGRVRLMDNQTFSVISNWYCLAVREMSRMDDFLADPEWISKQMNFDVSVKDISEAIKCLISTGLLVRNSSGDLEIAEGRIATNDDLSSEAVKRYHESMLDNAKLSLRKDTVEMREFTGTSLVLNTQNIGIAKKMIRDFRSHFSKTLEEDVGDEVYQIQVQFFPMTQFNKQKENLR